MKHAPTYILTSKRLLHEKKRAKNRNLEEMSKLPFEWDLIGISTKKPPNALKIRKNDAYIHAIYKSVKKEDRCCLDNSPPWSSDPSFPGSHFPSHETPHFLLSMSMSLRSPNSLYFRAYKSSFFGDFGRLHRPLSLFRSVEIFAVFLFPHPFFSLKKHHVMFKVLTLMHSSQ